MAAKLMLKYLFDSNLSANDLDTKCCIDDKAVTAHITNAEYDTKFVIPFTDHSMLAENHRFGPTLWS